MDWGRYWEEEPWGPWRDNVHIAMLAREIRRPQMQPYSRISLEQFMLVNPLTRAQEASAGLWNMLKTIAKPAGPKK